jgi:cytochrome b561
LHWVTAIIVIALWFIGRSITDLGPEQMDSRRALHVSVAASAWLLLVLRVFWRFRSGHPRIRGQSDLIHYVARTTHYTMLLLMIVMLFSGPILVWSSGNPIVIFGALSIPSPFGHVESMSRLAWFIHSNAAILLFWLVLLHIGGALKHLMFHSDDTIVRMIWPGKAGKDGAAT